MAIHCPGYFLPWLVYLVNASASVQAEIRVHAVIDVNIAHGPSEPLWACAAEVIQQIKAGAAILTRGGATLVYLCTTVLSGVASSTQTGEGTVMVLQIQQQMLVKQCLHYL